MRRDARLLAVAGLVVGGNLPSSTAFSVQSGGGHSSRIAMAPQRINPLNRRHIGHSVASSGSFDSRLFVSSTEEALGDRTVVAPPLDETEAGEASLQESLSDVQPANSLMTKLKEKIGSVDDERLLFPEYDSGEVPRMFSSLEYSKTEQGRVTGAAHVAGSVLGAATLVAGTTVGAGVLALPAATAAAGFLPSTGAMIAAWVYMTMSGLLIAELTLNRIADTGRPGLGILDLFESNLNKPLSQLGNFAYFFLHYAMLVAYMAQGGSNLSQILGSFHMDGLASLPPGVGQVAFGGICAAALFAGRQSIIEQVNNVLVFGVVASFLGILGLGAGGVNFEALLDPANQHPEQVVNCFPILFLAFTYQNVVPTIVNQLEGDRSKIMKAIIGGTAAPLLMFLAWNTVVLGNAVGADLNGVNPIELIESSGAGNGVMGPLVLAFSAMAVTTSVIGFAYGLIDAWRDLFNINPNGADYQKWKAPLYALVFGPPVALSMADPDIFYRALEYGGAFGVSTLFLVLPPIMVWAERYGEDQKPLLTKPMVPFGKIPLGSMVRTVVILFTCASGKRSVSGTRLTLVVFLSTFTVEGSRNVNLRTRGGEGWCLRFHQGTFPLVPIDSSSRS